VIHKTTRLLRSYIISESLALAINKKAEEGGSPAMRDIAAMSQLAL
jgi:hypothetical protein